MKYIKNIYETPVMEIIIFAGNDVVTLSNGGANGSSGSSDYEELLGGEATNYSW